MGASGVKPDAKALLAAASGTHKRKQARGGKPAAGSMDGKLAAASNRRTTVDDGASTQKENQPVNETRSRDATKRTSNRRPNPATSGKVKELETMNAELRLTVDGLERERDFYFGKLRDIEILLQANQEGEDANQEGEAATPQSETVQRIFKILYATEDDFEAESDAPETDRQDSAAAVAPCPEAAPVAVCAQ